MHRLHLILFVLFISVTAAMAADGGQILVDVRTAAAEAPMAGVTVTIQDQAHARPAQSATTDADGKARFSDLRPGTYEIVLTAKSYTPDKGTVNVTSGRPATYTALLELESEVGKRDIKVNANRVLVNTSNPTSNETKRNTTFIEQRTSQPASVQGIVSTAAGVQTDSVGQVHVRGDHKGLGIDMDGIKIPLQLEASTSQVVDPRFLDEVDLKVGNFDASEGGYGGVLALHSREGPVKPYVEIVPTVGTYGTYDLLLRAGGSNPAGDMQYFVGARHGATDNRVEPPDPHAQTLNNHGDDNNFLVRFSKQTKDDRLGLTLAWQQSRIGIPQTPSNFSAGVRQTLAESNLLGVASWKRIIDAHADFLMGVAILQSRQRVDNNGVFTPWVPFPAEISPDLNSAGLPLDPQNPGSPYLPNTTLSVFQIQPTVEFNYRFTDSQRIKLGATANVSRGSQSVDITDAGGGGGLPNPQQLPVPPTQYTANVHPHSFYGSAYFSHTFALVKDNVTVNYGVRADTYNDTNGVRATQLSPRINVAIATSDSSALRFSFNRLFQPPPLEIDTSGQSYALPQRTNIWEASYEFQPARDVVSKFALVYKDYRDQLDVGLLVPNSNIPVYAPVNFGSAYYKGAEFSTTTNHATGWNEFLTATVGVAKPLTPGPFDTNVPAYNDHDQRVQLTGGASYTWKNNLTAAFDFLYGSGYPQSALNGYNPLGIFPYGLNAGSGGRIGHFVANLNLNYMPRGADGKALGHGLGVIVQNVFDSRQVLNFFSTFSGTRFIQGRRFILNGFWRF